MLILKLHKSNEKYRRFLNELISSRWTRHQFYVSFSYKLSRIIDHWTPMDKTYDIPRSTTFFFDDENQNYHIGNNKNNSRLTNVWYRSYKRVLSYKIKLYNVDIPLPVCFLFFVFFFYIYTHTRFQTCVLTFFPPSFSISAIINAILINLWRTEVRRPLYLAIEVFGG